MNAHTGTSKLTTTFPWETGVARNVAYYVLVTNLSP